ncbi:MAG: hypothetical protein HYZ53_17540 [Planctomycetes bacterium]|nr:hypothetical protein [Planctomycetota bacterium]
MKFVAGCGLPFPGVDFQPVFIRWIVFIRGEVITPPCPALHVDTRALNSMTLKIVLEDLLHCGIEFGHDLELLGIRLPPIGKSFVAFTLLSALPRFLFPDFAQPTLSFSIVEDLLE